MKQIKRMNENRSKFTNLEMTMTQSRYNKFQSLKHWPLGISVNFINKLEFAVDKNLKLKLKCSQWR